MNDIKKMREEYKVARENERQRLLRLREATKRANLSLIKKLKLEESSKYILFIPLTTGLTPEDMERIDSRYVEQAIIVEDTKGIRWKKK